MDTPVKSFIIVHHNLVLTEDQVKMLKLKMLSAIDDCELVVNVFEAENKTETILKSVKTKRIAMAAFFLGSFMRTMLIDKIDNLVWENKDQVIKKAHD